MKNDKKLPDTYEFEKVSIDSSLDANIENMKRIFGNSSDLMIRPITICGVRTAVMCLEGMVSSFNTTQMVIQPLMEISLNSPSSKELYDHVKENMILAVDTGEETAFGNVIRRIMSGFAIMFVDGIPSALGFGIQGYAVRSVGEPSSEGNIMGAHEGFVETVRTNMSLIRRRVKSPLLQFRLFPVSPRSKTDVIVCFMADRVPKSLIDKICRQLEGLELETILGSGYIAPFLDGGSPAVFSGLTTTERPDVMCAKLLEGRVGILIDGTPFAIVVPAMFTENFQTLDDYNYRPYYAVFLRYIRYLSFFLSVFFPGIYVAAALFHPEMFNSHLLMNLAAAQESAPLNLMWEALITLIFYEIVREAGVRLPKSVGGAVSIVGGLIIGDAAVSAGIISNPMLLICAISVTASFVIPSLDQQVTLFRIAAVIMGGIFGLYGIALLSAFLLANICAAENYGLPVMAPLSPFTRKAMGDVAIRLGFGKMGGRGFTVEKLNGVDMEQHQ
ncbi:MAG: spore germination protein [Oscillospiraceae bacterium]|nr:spore germination protein [Oscillospiraceae bacterium]